MMLTGNFRAAAVTIAEHTVAAPPISALMASIPEGGFSEMPPLRAEVPQKHRNRNAQKKEHNYLPCKAEGEISIYVASITSEHISL